MPKATWNGVVVAESAETIEVDGNQYFPPNAIDERYFKPSETQSYCPWKGHARYYTIEVNGEQNPDAAWYYPEASEKARHFENYVAFWKGVVVE